MLLLLLHCDCSWISFHKVMDDPLVDVFGLYYSSETRGAWHDAIWDLNKMLVKSFIKVSCVVTYYKPQALQRGAPFSSRRHKGVVVVAQLEHMGSESWSLSTVPIRRPECGFKCFGRGALCSFRLNGWWACVNIVKSKKSRLYLL